MFILIRLVLALALSLFSLLNNESGDLLVLAGWIESSSEFQYSTFALDHLNGILFFTFAWVLQNAFNDVNLVVHLMVFLIFFILLSFLPSLFTGNLKLKSSRLFLHYFLLTLLMLYMGDMIVHLLRQFFAISIFSISLYLLANRKLALFFISSVIVTLIHFSIAPYLFLFAIFNLFNNKNLLKTLIFIFLSVITFYLFYNIFGHKIIPRLLGDNDNLGALTVSYYLFTLSSIFSILVLGTFKRSSLLFSNRTSLSIILFTLLLLSLPYFNLGFSEFSRRLLIVQYLFILLAVPRLLLMVTIKK
jgi:hypothetical protein